MSYRSLIRWLYTIDPGGTALKQSFGTLLVIGLLWLVFRHHLPDLMINGITAILLSRSQTGNTMEERRFSMIITGAVLALVTLLIPWIAPSKLLSVLFLSLAALIVFFFIGLRILPDFPAVSVLALTVVQMAFVKDFSHGLKSSLVILAITALVFLVHFVLFPIKPLRRLRIQQSLIAGHLKIYFEAVFGKYQHLEEAIEKTLKQGIELRQRISEFRKLVHLFGIEIDHEDQEESRMLRNVLTIERIYDHLLTIWQFRAGSWPSELYERLIIQNIPMKQIIRKVTEIACLTHPEGCHEETEKLLSEIEHIKNQLINQYQNADDPASREEWIAVFNTLSVVHQMIEGLRDFAPDYREEIIRFSATEKWKRFLNAISGISHSITFRHEAFRFGVRSAMIVGMAQLFYRYFEPQFGYWLVLFAVLLIRPNVGISVKTGRDRLVGTLAGIAVALIFLKTIPASGIAFSVIIVIALSIMLWYFYLDKMLLMLIPLTFLIVVMFTIIYAEEDKILLFRMAYTTVIVLGVIVFSSLLWPEMACKKLHTAIYHALNKEKELFEYLIRTIREEKTPDPQRFQEYLRAAEIQLQKTDELLEASRHEFFMSCSLLHSYNQRILLRRILNTLRSSGLMLSEIRPDAGRKLITELTERLGYLISLYFNNLADSMKNLKLTPEYPEISAELENVITRLRTIRINAPQEKSDMLFLWDISAIVWNLKTLILELDEFGKTMNLYIHQR